MADLYTPALNLTKPEVGASFDSLGGKLNTDMDLLDAVFLSTGLGTSVGLHVGADKTLNVEGSMQIADPVDTTKRAVLLASQIATATTQSYSFPNASGTLALQSVMPTGTVLTGYYGAAAPAGFVFLAGRTIGDAASSATERANADTVNLYTLFWTLGSVPTGGRGASAAADFDAHKPMALPDHRGRVMVARDNLGGTAAGVAPGWTSVGIVGGEWSHTLGWGEMPAHTHGGANHNHNVGNHTHGGESGQSILYANHGYAWGTSSSGGNSIGFSTVTGFMAQDPVYTGLSNHDLTTGNAGSGTAHNNVQPSITVDAVIAL